MRRKLVGGEAKRKKRVRGEKRERWEKWFRAEASVWGEKKLQGVRFCVPLVLPLREVGRAVRFGG